jgi:hypothetical protein
MSKSESAANVECSIGGIRQWGWRSGLMGPTKVSEAAHGRIGGSPAKLSKGS